MQVPMMLGGGCSTVMQETFASLQLLSFPLSCSRTRALFPFWAWTHVPRKIRALFLWSACVGVYCMHASTDEGSISDGWPWHSLHSEVKPQNTNRRQHQYRYTVQPGFVL